MSCLFPFNFDYFFAAAAAAAATTHDVTFPLSGMTLSGNGLDHMVLPARGGGGIGDKTSEHSPMAVAKPVILGGRRSGGRRVFSKYLGRKVIIL